MTRTVTALAKLFATAFGAGYSPVAPGTCGALVAVPLVWALAGLPVWQFALITAGITLLGVAAAHRADQAWGTEDSQRIVIDEVAGYMLTMLPVDRAAWGPVVIGFVVFRVLDVIKLPPARALDERMPGGWGVMFDDVAAGLQGAAVMALLGYFGVLDAIARL